MGGIDVTTEGQPMTLPEIPILVPAAPLQVDACVHQQVPSSAEVGLSSAQHEAAEQSVEMADVGSAVPVTPEEPGDEPAAKRANLSVSRVSGEDMVHVDETSLFEESLLNFDAYDDLDFHAITDDECFDDDQNDYFENEAGGDVSPHVDEHLLWYPMSQDEPLVDDETLQHLDNIADTIEISRLEGMHVLEHEGDDVDVSSLGSTLTAKFVRAWRKISKDGSEMWLRRSRLVAREFNRLELRDDLFSPALNHVVEKLITALAVSGVFPDSFVMGSLDIGDAYLQVPQSNRRRVKILDYPMDTDLLICRCLPGQRDGSRRWFDFFTSFLSEKLQVEQCAEQPAMFRLPASDGGGVLLVHVDDVLFLADARYVQEKLMPVLKSSFKVSMSMAPRTGGSFFFLKREHVVESNHVSITIVAENKHIKQAYQQYCKFGITPKARKTPGTSHAFSGHDGTKLVDDNKAAAFRSILGALLYISHERADIQYCTKSLESYLKSPTDYSWNALGCLLGYLNSIQHFATVLSRTSPGASLFQELNGGVNDFGSEMKSLVETFTDADWQGGRELRSTSAACHFLNGNRIHTSSRSQHVISLSSTESEFYASTSASTDAIYLKNIVSFVVDGSVEARLHTDNSASRQIACKLGTSRLRHISGRLLWMQSRIRENVFKIFQVGAIWNVAAIGAKLLPRDRHYMLVFMLGFVSDGEKIGEEQFLKQKHQEFSRRSIKMIKSMYGSNSDVGSANSSQQSTLAKQILQISVLGFGPGDK